MDFLYTHPHRNIFICLYTSIISVYFRSFIQKITEKRYGDDRKKHCAEKKLREQE